MPKRVVVCRWTLVTFGVVQVALAVPLLFFLGRFFAWIDWLVFDPTGDKVLGAALGALGVASLLAARDPVRHRVVVQTDILFCLLTGAALVYRLLVDDGMTPTAPMVVWLAVTAVFFALLAAFYPPHEAT